MPLPVGNSDAEVARINSHQPRFKKPFGSIITEAKEKPPIDGTDYDRPPIDGYPERYCDLDDQNNFHTAVTFYGDSRLDLIDQIGWGYGNLDGYLRASKEEGWNVQNLANSGQTADGLIKHISLCYRAKFPFSQRFEQDENKLSKNGDDFSRMMFPQYVTSKNIAFEIGGNDFLNKIPEFVYTPWMMPLRIENVRISIRNIVALLRRRNRNVLLVGNYPALSSSLALGSLNKQLDSLKHYRGTYFEMGQNTLPLSGGSYTLPEIGLFHDSITDLFIKYYTKGATTSPYKDFQPKDILTPVLNTTNPAKANPSIATYKGWVQFNTNDGGLVTSASIAMMFLEGNLERTIAETNSMPYVSDSISKAYYHSVWNLFVDPRLRDVEPWVANPLLMAEFIHPNAMGFKLWSDSVGAKIRSLDWHKNPKQFRRGELRDYDAMNTPTLAILLTIRTRLTDALDQINTTYHDLFEDNARLQISLRKKVIEGRLDQNNQKILIEIEYLEQQRLRLLAEAEARRLEAIRIAEQERLEQEAAIIAAANAEADRQRQIQAQIAQEEAARMAQNAANDALFLIGACFFFGICHF